MEKVFHPFEPIYDSQSKILILGTMPSVKSRKDNFYYAHPQNRFWKVISSITKSTVPETTNEKTKLLLDNRIAVWDVIKSCEIVNSSDSSIKHVVPNNIESLLQKGNIVQVYANGSTAKKLYDKHIFPLTSQNCTSLPSTSPANATISLEKLIDCWSQIKIYL